MYSVFGGKKVAGRKSVKTPRVAQLLLPNSHQPKQNRADSGTLEIQVNKTQSTSTWDTLYEEAIFCTDFNSDIGT